MKKLLSVVTLLCLSALSLMAQGTLKATTFNGVAIEGDKRGVYVGDNLTYNISFTTDEKVKSVTKFTVNGVEEKSVTVTVDAEGKVPVFSYNAATATAGEKNLPIELTYVVTRQKTITETVKEKDPETGEEKDVEKDKVVDEDVTLTASSTIVYTVYSVPDFSSVAISATGGKVKGYTDESFAFTITGLNTSEGFPNGWTYSWKVDGTEKSTTNQLSVSNLAAGSHNVTLSVRNSIGGSTTAGREGSASPLSFTVYSVPDFTGLSASVSPLAHVVSGSFAFTSSNTKENTGDPSGWSYEWKMGDQNSTVKTANFSASTVGTHTATLTATNTITGTTSTRTSTKDVSVTIYADGSLGTVDHPRNAIEGSNIKFTATLNGGKSKHWTSAEATFGGTTKTATSIGNSDATFYFTAPSVSTGNSQSVALTAISAENRPDDVPAGETASINSTGLNESVTIWRTPTANCATCEMGGEYANVVPYGQTHHKADESPTLGVTIAGGVCYDNGAPIFNTQNGWSVDWTVDGNNVKSNTTTFNIVPYKDGLPHTYRAIVKSYVDGTEVYDQSYEWKDIIVWSVPEKPEVEVDAFVGEPAYFSFNFNSGFTGREAGWRFWFRIVGEEQWEEVNNGGYATESPAHASSPNIAKDTDRYEWKAQNYDWNGNPWGEEFSGSVNGKVALTPTLLCSTYPTLSQKANGEFTGEADVYFDNTIRFNLQKSEGIDGKWNILDIKFAFIGTNDVKSSPRFYDLQGVEVNPGDAMLKAIGEVVLDINRNFTINNEGVIRDVLVRGTVTNGTPGAPNEKKIPVNLVFHVWPQLQVTSLTAAPLAVREGDNVALNVDFTECYKNQTSVALSYDYTFGENVRTGVTRNGLELPSWIEPGDQPGTSNMDASVRVHITGPNGQEWAIENAGGAVAKDVASTKVTVYRRPKQPQSVEMFGNGTTGSYYVEMGIGDDALPNYLYYMTDGNEANTKESEHRLFTIPASWNTSALRAATAWTYDNGKTRIYSDYVLRNGAVEVCPLSRIGNFDNRGVDAGEESGIETLTIDTNEQPLYDMTGRRVETTKTGRLYIVGGKKVIGK